MSTKVEQVAILGGRGYVGSEIIKILNNHDHFYLAKVFSSSAAGTLVDIYSKDKSLKEMNSIEIAGTAENIAAIKH